MRNTKLKFQVHTIVVDETGPVENWYYHTNKVSADSHKSRWMRAHRDSRFPHCAIVELIGE